METQPEALEFAPLEMAALAQVSKDAKKFRDRLVQGKGQMVDFTIRVRGAVDVGADHAAIVNDPLDTLLLLGLIFDRLAPRTRSQVLRDLRGASDDWAASGEVPSVSKDAEEAATQLIEAAKRKGTQQRRGAVTASLSLTLLERGQAAAA